MTRANSVSVSHRWLPGCWPASSALRGIGRDDPTTALDWLDDDIHYLLALPAGVVTGHSKKDFADYIDSRTPIERIHHVARHQVDGETEFVVGTVT